MILTYKDYGQGEPLFILHGLFGSLDNWQTLAKRFAEDYHVYIVDQRNHGHSFHADEMNYQVMAEDLLALINHLGLDTINLLGHSMGGKTAMTFSMNWPERLNKLLIADIGPQQYKMHHQKILEALHHIDRIKDLDSRKKADQLMSEFIDEPGVRMFLLKNLHWKEKGQLAWRMNLPVISENMRHIVASVGTEMVHVPSLFLAGGASDYITAEDHMMIQMQFPQSEIIEMMGAGHWLHAEQPDEFYQLVTDFLSF